MVARLEIAGFRRLGHAELHRWLRASSANEIARAEITDGGVLAVDATLVDGTVLEWRGPRVESIRVSGYLPVKSESVSDPASDPRFERFVLCRAKP